MQIEAIRAHPGSAHVTGLWHSPKSFLLHERNNNSPPAAGSSPSPPGITTRVPFDAHGGGLSPEESPHPPGGHQSHQYQVPQGPGMGRATLGVAPKSFSLPSQVGPQKCLNLGLVSGWMCFAAGWLQLPQRPQKGANPEVFPARDAACQKPQPRG